MVGVAQLVEHGIVTPVVVGSIPIVHPIFRKGARLIVWRLFCFSGLSIQRLQVVGRRAGRFVVFVFLDDAAVPADLACKIGCQGDAWQPLLYKEGLAQSLGVIGCICHRGEVHSCIRTYKLPAAFLPVFSRVTS